MAIKAKGHAGRLSYCGEQVQRYDHDRFLTALFAPVERREALYTLYAFNLEIAKVSEVVTEPIIGEMRLQWWRDVLDRVKAGESVSHAVARPLGTVIGSYGLERSSLERLIDSRSQDLHLTQPAGFPEFADYAEATGGELLSLALQILGHGQSEFRQAALAGGRVWAMTGLLRAIPFHARRRRIVLPVDVMTRHGIDVWKLIELRPGPSLQSCVRELAYTIRGTLDEARHLAMAVPRKHRSPLLVLPLADLYLRDLEQAEWDPFLLASRPARPLLAASLAARAILGRY